MIAQQLYTSSTIVTFILAVILIGILTWRVRTERFRSIRWVSVGLASGVFWAALAVLLIMVSWESYYQYFVPAWYRYVAPIGALILYALIGVFLRWVAIRLPGNPVLWFCLLGGLEAIPEHLVGIYRFDILEIPFLEGSSAISILIFAYFEYVVYWSIVLIISLVVDRLFRVIN